MSKLITGADDETVESVFCVKGGIEGDLPCRREGGCADVFGKIGSSRKRRGIRIGCWWSGGLLKRDRLIWKTGIVFR